MSSVQHYYSIILTGRKPIPNRVGIGHFVSPSELPELEQCRWGHYSQSPRINSNRGCLSWNQDASNLCKTQGSSSLTPRLSAPEDCFERNKQRSPLSMTRFQVSIAVTEILESRFLLPVIQPRHVTYIKENVQPEIEVDRSPSPVVQVVTSSQRWSPVTFYEKNSTHLRAQYMPELNTCMTPIIDETMKSSKLKDHSLHSETTTLETISHSEDRKLKTKCTSIHERNYSSKLLERNRTKQELSKNSAHNNNRLKEQKITNTSHTYSEESKQFTRDRKYLIHRKQNVNDSHETRIAQIRGDREYQTFPLSPIQETNNLWLHFVPSVSQKRLHPESSGHVTSQKNLEFRELSKNRNKHQEDMVFSSGMTQALPVPNKALITSSSKPTIMVSEHINTIDKLLNSEGTFKLRSKLSTTIDMWKKQSALGKDMKTSTYHFFEPGKLTELQKNTILGLSTVRRWRRLNAKRSKHINLVDPLNRTELENRSRITAAEIIERDIVKPSLDRHGSTSTRQSVHGTTHYTPHTTHNPSHEANRKVPVQHEESLSGSEKSQNMILSSKLTNFMSKVETWRTSGPYRLNVDQPKVRHSASLPSLMSFLPKNLPKAASVPTSVIKQTPKLQPATSLQQSMIRSTRRSRGHSNVVLQKSPWKPERRSNLETVVIFGRSRSLRKTRSQGDFSKMSSNFMPLVKFRRLVKMILHLLNATYNTRDRSQSRYNNLWANFLGSNWTATKSAYEVHGISFDPREFKAKREIPVSIEAKAILSLEPSRRTTHQLRQVLISLRQAVKEFSEFPITMQESLVRVGWYENFEAKRVIIRQGHTADNFYFILSGTAAVVVLESDKQTGEQVPRTAAFLGKGKSFGELALMHKSRRSATVTCKDDVELLAVGREDFIDIFMHVERGVEPEHVTFLRSLPILQDWPLEVLPFDNPQILLFTYVRRGVLLCKDSNTSDWIYVVKSGHCRVVKALRAVRAVKWPTPRDSSDTSTLQSTLSPYPLLPGIRQKTKTSVKVTNGCGKGNFNVLSYRDCGKGNFNVLSYRDPDQDERDRQEHLQTLDAILEQRSMMESLMVPYESGVGLDSSSYRHSVNSSSTGTNVVFVDVVKLVQQDIYGLEPSVFKSLKKTTSTSLVSGGAEVIMIDRKFFLDHTSEELRKKMRREIRPLPSEETLQAQLDTMVNWEVYRHQTLKDTVNSRKRRSLPDVR
ncbi:hypothetical protein Btru_066107 [Bulinus truncatus]|nr:hypothetical protein Btru_066107 [Bulinus truncatus]